MTDQFLGEIRMFGGNFAPQGWAFCNGQIIPINQNTALFSLLGHAVRRRRHEQLRAAESAGREPDRPGQRAGPDAAEMGETGGAESVTLTQQQLPSHSHVPNANAGGGTTTSPSGARLGSDPRPALRHGDRRHDEPERVVEHGRLAAAQQPGALPRRQLHHRPHRHLPGAVSRRAACAAFAARLATALVVLCLVGAGLLALAGPADAASPGSLDTTWNGTGIVTTSIGGVDIANAVVVQPDGDTIAAGTAQASVGSATHFALVRYTPNGSLDSTFAGWRDRRSRRPSSRPRTATRPTPWRCRPTARSSLPVRRRTPPASARWPSPATTATEPSTRSSVPVARPWSWSATGRTTPGKAMTIEPNGNIVVVGIWFGGWAVARFTPAGVLDTTFNPSRCAARRPGVRPRRLVLRQRLRGDDRNGGRANRHRRRRLGGAQPGRRRRRGQRGLRPGPADRFRRASTPRSATPAW